MYVSKTKLWSIVISAGVLVVILTSYSQRNILELKGDQLYTPSRLEWLEMQLYAKYGGNGAFTSKRSDDVLITTFEAKPATNTIRVNIIYNSSMQAARLDDIKEKLKIYVMLQAAKNGWDDWCQVEVEARSIESVDDEILRLLDKD